MAAREEVYDLLESEKYCLTCGLPFKEMSGTEDSEVLETQEVRGYRRTIRRKKYTPVRGWAESWEERINALFHLNKVRVSYARGSSAFSREDRRLRQAVVEMEEILREERKLDRLHHSQRSVLKSLDIHWGGLTVFVDHPEIPMDNNGSERTLRNPVVSRKNYYGSGAIWSARFTAVMFSIFETLQLWKINQLEWLSDYFRACALAGGKQPEDIAGVSALEYQRTGSENLDLSDIPYVRRGVKR